MFIMGEVSGYAGLLALALGVELAVAQSATSSPPARVPPLDTGRVMLAPSSSISIRGRTNVGRWRCVSQTIQAAAQIDRAGARWATADKAYADSVRVRAVLGVPVASLACDSRRMEQGLSRALHAETYPVIRFRITSYSLRRLAGGYDGSVMGDLTLNGATLPVRVHTTIRIADDTAHATGGVDLRMTSFGVRPPSAFWGLVRARDALTVRFDLRAVMR